LISAERLRLAAGRAKIGGQRKGPAAIKKVHGGGVVFAGDSEEVVLTLSARRTRQVFIDPKVKKDNVAKEVEGTERLFLVRPAGCWRHRIRRC
jgi:hypothetical protein